MRSLMLELISGGNEYDAALEKKVHAYIDASTGIQTVYQMQWLKNETEQAGYGAADRDVWWYKDAYNARLMAQVSLRVSKLMAGEYKKDAFLIKGAVAFLHFLREKGIKLYLASGTDHDDVMQEAAALGVAQLFCTIKGAPNRQFACSKEAVMQMLLEESGLPAEQVLLVGDGKVEIALGAAHGAYTLGVASNEAQLEGVNPVKRERLLRAGADAIIGDFQDLQALSHWLQIS